MVPGGFYAYLGLYGFSCAGTHSFGWWARGQPNLSLGYTVAILANYLSKAPPLPGWCVCSYLTLMVHCCQPCELVKARPSTTWMLCPTTQACYTSHTSLPPGCILVDSRSGATENIPTCGLGRENMKSATCTVTSWPPV